MTADAGMTEAELDRFERVAEPVYRSTVEAGDLHRFAVSDLGGFTLRLVAEVRRLREENGRLRAHIGRGVTAEPVAVVERVHEDQPVITARVYAPESWEHLGLGTHLYAAVRPSGQEGS